jgi:uncharacterized protein GlcG (DUF336 family)
MPRSLTSNLAETLGIGSKFFTLRMTNYNTRLVGEFLARLTPTLFLETGKEFEMKKVDFIVWLCLVVALFTTLGVSAQDDSSCTLLPNHDTLQAALRSAQAQDNGGFALNMWATVVNRDGIVCAVAFTGEQRGDQWPGSRVISAQKANTANAFSLPDLVLSTAQLYAATQPGGSLFGLQESNPVDTSVAYGGDPAAYGQPDDPMVGNRIGGVNVFGGGLALYDSEGTLLGGIGVSGDSSCADHNIAWKTRDALELDNIPGGVSPTGDDNIVYDLDADGMSAGGWGHPVCSDAATEIAASLPDSLPVSG